MVSGFLEGEGVAKKWKWYTKIIKGVFVPKAYFSKFFKVEDNKLGGLWSIVSQISRLLVIKNITKIKCLKNRQKDSNRPTQQLILTKNNFQAKINCSCVVQLFYKIKYIIQLNSIFNI